MGLNPSERAIGLAQVGALRAIAEALERIEDSLPVAPDAHDPGHVLVSQIALEKALHLVRDALDGSLGSKDTPDVGKLFEAEDLLCRELGHPIWEGRRE